MLDIIVLVTETTAPVTTPGISKVTMVALPIIVVSLTIMVFKLVLITIPVHSLVTIGRTHRTKPTRELGTRERRLSHVTIKDAKIIEWVPM
jgi:hypothetical protein